MTKKREPTAVTMAARTATILFVFVIVFTGLLAGAYIWTKPALEASAAEEKMKLIDEVLPRSAYDNDLLKDTVALPASPLLGTDEETLAYRARKGSQPVALVFEAVAPDGYSGKIRLILAVNFDGSITAWTRSGPSASTAIAATRAESMPPDNPSTTPGNAFLST